MRLKCASSAPSQDTTRIALSPPTFSTQSVAACYVATRDLQHSVSPPLKLPRISFEASETVDVPVWPTSFGDERKRGCHTIPYLGRTALRW